MQAPPEMGRPARDWASRRARGDGVSRQSRLLTEPPKGRKADRPQTDEKLWNAASGSASDFLRDLMALARFRYGPGFTFPNAERGRAHAILALGYAVRVDNSMTPEARAVAWADLWSPWMLIHTTGHWRDAMLDPGVAAALQSPPSFDGASDGAAVRLDPLEFHAINARLLVAEVWS